MANFAANPDLYDEPALTLTFGLLPYPAEYPRFRRNSPKTAELLELLRAAADENGQEAVTAGHYDLSRELRRKFVDIAGVDEWHAVDHSTALYLNLPDDMRRAIPAHVVEELTTPKKIEEDWAEFFEPSYGGGPAVQVAADATKAERRAAVLARYQMRAPDVTISYWSNYTASLSANAFDANCLISDLISIYCVGAKSKRIAPATIAAYFENGARSTISRVIEFCKCYHIPAKIWSVLGDYPVVEYVGSDADNQRKGLALIAFQNHCYWFTGKSVKSCVPKLQPGVTLPTARFNCVEEKKRSAEEDSIRAHFLKKIRPNFSYISERRVCAKALTYDHPTYTLEDQKNRQSIDMAKAFYSSLMAADKTHLVGVYTPHDTIITIPAGKEFPIAPENYYFVNKNAIETWRDCTDLRAARKNNLLLGFELTYMLDHNLISIADIEAYKKPSYKISPDSFRKTLYGFGDVARQMFALCNGLMGKTVNEASSELHQMYNDDAALIEVTHTATVAEAPDYFNDPRPDIKDVNITRGKAEYLFLNNRHLYNFVVSQTNLQMMKAYDAMKSSACELIRVRTDSITWRTVCDDEVFSEKVKGLAVQFREVAGGGKPSKRYVNNMEYLDHNEITKNTRAEIDAWVSRQRCVTGPPGSGKSYLIKYNQVNGEDEYKFNRSMAFTNMCARQLDTQKDGKTIAGATIHSTLQLFSPESVRDVAKQLKGSTVWLDEISQVNGWIWSILYIIGLDAHFILSGDPNQCSPIGSKADGKPTGDILPWGTGYLLSNIISKSVVVKDGPNSRNDADLIKFRDAIQSQAMPIVPFRDLLKDRPELDGANRRERIFKCDHHIVLANSYRIALNIAIVKARGLLWEHKITATSPKTVYAFTASAGVKLVSKSTKKNANQSTILQPDEVAGYYKSDFYTLKENITFESKTARLVNISTGKELTILAPMLEDFNLGYAITSPSSQGMTIDGELVIHQMGTMLANGGDFREMAYTAVTRARKLSNLLFIRGKMDLEDVNPNQSELWGTKSDADECDTVAKDLIVN